MILGYILAAGTILVWGITFVSTKSLLQSFSPLEILFFRYTLAYFCLWGMRPKWEKINFKDNLLYAFAGLTGVALYQFSENAAINFTTASNVSIIVAICPLFAAIFTQVFLKEKQISVFFIIGFVLSIFGIALVCFNGKISLNINPKGDLLALLAAICWGVYSIFVSLINRKGYDSVCSTRRIFFFAVIFMIPLYLSGYALTRAGAATELARSMSVTFDALINKTRFTNLFNIANLLFLSLFASSICFTAWNKACNILGTVKATKGLYLIPVVTIIFSTIFLHEKLTLMGVLGAALTITGLFISGIRKEKTHEKNN